ncbi:MAG: T9SS type A sorting domain-containing protein [Cryomorphaceae bacterium]|nr:T9SS type A sorting domain-containing protein [Cryomorphaceae bacterium]
MKKLLLFSLLLASGLYSKAQMVGVEVEEYAVHTGMVGATDLTGYTTYRLYAVLGDQDDFVSAIFGLAGKPLEVRTSTSFWQTPLGGATGDAVNPAIFGVFPETEFDSFVTIGRANSNDPGTSITAQQSAAEPWVTNFEAGNDVVISGLIGGAWFTLFSAQTVNAIAGPDNKVLIGQFTTDGVFDGYVNAQIFLNGVQADDQEFLCFPFSSEAGAVAGCNDPAALNYDVDATYLDCSCEFECTLAIANINTTPITCAGQSNGTAQITVSGQQGGAVFNLDGGNNLAVGNYNNLAGGDHTITITDSEGCQVVQTFQIPAPAPVSVSLALTSPITCNGNANAVITGTPAGGTGAFTYSLASNMSNPTSTPVFSDLTPGLYTVYAVDANGCTGQSTSLNVTQPLAVQVNVSSSAAASCSDSSDGIIVCVGFGGAGGIQYSLDNINFQTSNIFNIGPGTYTIYGVDVNGCADTSNSPVTISSPAAVGFASTTTDVLCNGGSDGFVDVAANGGNGGFTYSFEGGDFGSVSDWSGLPAGDYTVVAVDDEGCQGTVTLTVAEPTIVAVSSTTSNPLCTDDTNGSITFIATGGTPDYTYTVDGEIVTNGVLDGLASGSYDVVVTDMNGCVVNATASLTNPAALDVTGSSNQESATGANDGDVQITATGGTGTLSYEWTGPNGFTSSNEDITGLGGGSYEVTVTDANGCSMTMSFDVTTGVAELENGVEVNVFPNPTNGIVTLNLSGLNGQSVNVTILDGQGRIVLQEGINAGGAQFSKNMDLSFAADGFYFMQITVGNYSSTVKVLKQ